MTGHRSLTAFIAVVGLAGCSSSPTTVTTTPTTVTTTPTTVTTPSPGGEATTVMTALCTVQAQPTANATANAAFFSVHDTLHELADRLNAKDERDLSARVLQATAAVEAHVEETSTSVPWPQATAALVDVIPTAYAALGIAAPACG